MRIFLSRSFLLYTAITIIIVIAVTSLFTLATRASVKNLYASTCLGGWENTERAAGAPEALESGGAPVFTGNNSARLSGDAHAQIYCGGFMGDIVENTVPKKILVKFSWAVEYPTLPTDSLVTDEESATSTETLTDTPEIENPLGNDVLEGGEIDATESEPAPEDSVEEVATPEVEPAPDPAPESQPEPAPDSLPAPTSDKPVSFLNFFATVAYAQEVSVEDSTATTSEEDSTATTTTPDNIPALTVPYGLVEVLYTLDGIEWKSLGFVEKDEFRDKYFEIPIEEASDWEGISKIQIGVQSVPVIDGVAPTIYLDAVWIEAEYELLGGSDSQVATVIEALFTDEDEKSDEEKNVTEFNEGEIADDEVLETEEPEEEVVVEENESEESVSMGGSGGGSGIGFEILEGEKSGEDEEIESDPCEESYEGEENCEEKEEFLENELEQDYSPPLSKRVFNKNIEIDPNAPHRCEVLPFNMDITDITSATTSIAFEKNAEDIYEAEIGSLPDGVVVKFSNNDDYVYKLGKRETSADLIIIAEDGARNGSFSIPIIYTRKGGADSSTVCQLNIVNL